MLLKFHGQRRALKQLIYKYYIYKEVFTWWHFWPSLVQPFDHILLAADILVKQHIHGLLVRGHRNILDVVVDIFNLELFLSVKQHIHGLLVRGHRDFMLS